MTPSRANLYPTDELSRFLAAQAERLNTEAAASLTNGYSRRLRGSYWAPDLDHFLLFRVGDVHWSESATDSYYARANGPTRCCIECVQTGQNDQGSRVWLRQHHS